MDKVLLCGINTGERPDYDHTMEELNALAKACDMEPVGMTVQNLPYVNKTHYVGSGKVQELKDMVFEYEADLIIFNDSLSPSQLRNIQDEVGVGVMDRTTLILEIFARRAGSKEAMLQVETARLKYLLPRLIGLHDALSRQGGTSGSMSSRGAGETKLELDRRRLTARLHELERELKEVETNRDTQMKKRRRSGIPRAALVGYTNAGKSTIMNKMIDAYAPENIKDKGKVLQKDMLFATLDTTVRKMCPGQNKDFLLSDTVGFIDQLPHGLVKAFRSTLSEAADADLILQVVDYSDPYYEEHLKVTKETLEEIGASSIPVLYVYNKCDRAEDPDLTYPLKVRDSVYVAIGADLGLDTLKEAILEKLYPDQVKIRCLIPYDRGDIYNKMMERNNVLSTSYEAEGISVELECSLRDCAAYKKWQLI